MDPRTNICVDSSYTGYSLTVYADTVAIAGHLRVAGADGSSDHVDGADSGDLKIVARRIVCAASKPSCKIVVSGTHLLCQLQKITYINA